MNVCLGDIHVGTTSPHLFPRLIFCILIRGKVPINTYIASHRTCRSTLRAGYIYACKCKIYLNSCSSRPTVEMFVASSPSLWFMIEGIYMFNIYLKLYTISIVLNFVFFFSFACVRVGGISCRFLQYIHYLFIHFCVACIHGILIRKNLWDKNKKRMWVRGQYNMQCLHQSIDAKLANTEFWFVFLSFRATIIHEILVNNFDTMHDCGSFGFLWHLGLLFSAPLVH